MKLFGSGKLLAAASFVVAASAFAPGVARANLAVGAEVGPVIQLDPPNDSKLTIGFAGRVGYKLSLPLIALTPEAKFAFHPIQDSNTIRVMAGARLQLGAILSPNAFVHGGYGTVSGGDAKGLAFDAGVGLDFTPLPLLDVGVLASYNRITDDGAKLHWIFVGANATLAF